MLGSLFIVAGLLYWDLSGSHRPQWWVSLVAVLGISIASNLSLRRRARAINQKYSGRYSKHKLLLFVLARLFISFPQFSQRPSVSQWYVDEHDHGIDEAFTVKVYRMSGQLVARAEP
jgi:hypothetical protein